MSKLTLEDKLNLLHDEVLVLKRDHPKVLEHLTNLDRQVTDLWSKVIQMQFDIARIRAGIPGRTNVYNFTVADNDEAKKLSDDIDKSVAYPQAPTKEDVKVEHQCQCSTCDPN